MHVVIPKVELVRILECYTAADKKSAFPAYANTLLTAKGGKLAACATDMYVSLSDSAPADIAVEGSIGLPARDIFDRVKAMPEGPIEFRVEDGHKASFRAVSAKRWFSMTGISASDFPPLATIGEGATWTIAATALQMLIERTGFSIDSSVTSAYSNAFFEWRGGKARAVSSDGHRLSVQEIPTDANVSQSFALPLRATTELRRFLAGVDGDVRIHVNRTKVFFCVGDAVLSSALADVDMPPYQQVIPSPRHPVRVSRTLFADALKSVRLGATLDEIKLTLSDGILSVSTGALAGDEIPVDYHQKTVFLGINAKYVLDVLDVLDADLEIDIIGELQPIIIKPADDSTYIAVVMAMKL